MAPRRLHTLSLTTRPDEDTDVARMGCGAFVWLGYATRRGRFDRQLQVKMGTSTAVYGWRIYCRGLVPVDHGLDL